MQTPGYQRVIIQGQEADTIEDEDYDEDEPRECPACGQLNAPLGSLGQLDHYNCRYCGMWYSA